MIIPEDFVPQQYPIPEINTGSIFKELNKTLKENNKMLEKIYKEIKELKKIISTVSKKK